MMQWMTLFQKEMLENWRNRKWIWIPIVIMLLAIMDPLTYYFLPEIIEMSGGMPEGTVFEMPQLDASEVIATSLETLGMYGIIIIALATMGVIAGERKSGITEMILVKPVNYTNYITAKWAAHLLLILASLTVGLFLAWYYTNLLYGGLEFTMYLKLLAFYSIWFIFVLSLSIFFNALFRSPGAVAASTIFTVVLLSGINLAVGHKLPWFPVQLTAHIQQLSMTGEIPQDLWGTVCMIILIIVILLLSTISIFKGKEIV